MLSDFRQIINVVAILTFIIVVVFFIIVSLILNYHWNRYGIEIDKIKKIKRLYFGVSILFFTIIVGALISLLYD